MNPCRACRHISEFMTQHIPDLLGRYELFFHQEDLFVEYFLEDRKDHHEISTSLHIALNRFSHHIHVTKFYPELYREENHKYLSAVCFFLMIHHFAACQHINEECSIYIETKSPVFDHFYSRLPDFDFHIDKEGLGNTVELAGAYHPTDIDTKPIVHKREIVWG